MGWRTEKELRNRVSVYEDEVPLCEIHALPLRDTYHRKPTAVIR